MYLILNRHLDWWRPPLVVCITWRPCRDQSSGGLEIKCSYANHNKTALVVHHIVSFTNSRLGWHWVPGRTYRVKAVCKTHREDIALLRPHNSTQCRTTHRREPCNSSGREAISLRQASLYPCLRVVTSTKREFAASSLALPSTFIYNFRLHQTTRRSIWLVC